MEQVNLTHELIEIIRENEELKRGIGDALLILNNFDIPHHSLKNSNTMLSEVLSKLSDMASDYRKLKHYERENKQTL